MVSLRSLAVVFVWITLSDAAATCNTPGHKTIFGSFRPPPEHCNELKSYWSDCSEGSPRYVNIAVAGVTPAGKTTFIKSVMGTQLGLQTSTNARKAKDGTAGLEIYDFGKTLKLWELHSRAGQFFDVNRYDINVCLRWFDALIIVVGHDVLSRNDYDIIIAAKVARVPFAVVRNVVDVKLKDEKALPSPEEFSAQNLMRLGWRRVADATEIATENLMRCDKRANGPQLLEFLVSNISANRLLRANESEALEAALIGERCITTISTTTTNTLAAPPPRAPTPAGGNESVNATLASNNTSGPAMTWLALVLKSWDTHWTYPDALDTSPWCLRTALTFLILLVTWVVRKPRPAKWFFVLCVNTLKECLKAMVSGRPIARGDDNLLVVAEWTGLQKRIWPIVGELTLPTHNCINVDDFDIRLVTPEQTMTGIYARGSNRRLHRQERWFWLKSRRELEEKGRSRSTGICCCRRRGWPQHWTEHLKVAHLLKEELMQQGRFQEGDEFDYVLGLSADGTRGFRFSSCANLRLDNTQPHSRQVAGVYVEQMMSWMRTLYPGVAAINDGLACAE